MKTASVASHLFLPIHRVLTAGFLALAFVRFPAFATTFTNDTTISASNTNYDGADVMVTNCTLTVDGVHAFSSLFVAGGGALTHSFSPNGSISNIFFVANESQVLNDTNPVTLLNSNILTDTVLVTDSGSTTIYTNGVDYLLTSPDGILTQLQRTTNSTIPDGTNVLVSYDVLLGMLPGGFNLSVTGNVEVAVGGVINANGKGYGGSAGPGAGHTAGSPADGSGAGYGGIGGMSSSNAVGGTTYGSFTQPTDLGSGGGAGYAGVGGAGGGAIQITAGGIFLINGTISANGANGTNSRSGGGSGGSIWITAHLVSGSGAITAQGGAGEPTHGGGGGGGRIAIQCDANTFAGSVAAYGGAGAKTGGAGTVYTQLTGQNGLLVFDNGGQAGTNSLAAISSSSVDVLIRGKAGVIPAGAWFVGNLTIASNGLLLASSALSPLNLIASGNVTIQSGGSLLADSAGSPAGSGSGYGYSYYGTGYPCGGGGHGGSGANGSSTNASGGTTYGSQTSPTTYGSGGGMFPPFSVGGAGGGAIRLNVSGILQVDGRITANGGNGSGSGGGGGAGGSIWLTSGILTGSGSITVNGGNGVDSIGGGGGGGRIAIYPAANLFGGAISAYGGGGANWGGAGTVFLQPTGQNGQLILDNGGNIGTNTLVQSASSADLILRNGAIGSASGSVSFANLLMSSNAWLTAYRYYYGSPANTVYFSFSGNATIQAGSGILTDAAGYPGGQGSGAGQYYSSLSTYPCSGAGHGGHGASSTGNYAAGGNIYDYMTSPTGYGSGGGAYSPYSFGGSGGGAIHLTVTGTLQMDGTISANGGNGSGTGGGGGSGGSIWLAVGTLSGAGSITANGGSGADSIGGGGGGGIIYIPCNNNFFTGNVLAYGGGGANWGGAGTVLIQPYGQNGQLILDNGGHPGTSTLLQSVKSADLTLRNGAIGLISGPLTFGNLLVSSNAWLLISNYSYTVTLSSATIQAGGGILADAAGYAAGTGSGAGQYSYNSPYPCSGAGHGGYGASGTGNYPAGGTVYDSITSPTSPGSGGGYYSSYSVGGAGGGAIRLNVSGTLQVAGLISANGGNGSGTGGGGGSGGSIWFVVGTLSGSGSITANGGGGADSVGGGGGGGRIYISCNNNSFTGNASACGGGGAYWGGAGTVLIQPYGQSGQLILDNGGHAGPNTPLQSVSSADLTLRNGAIGVISGPLTFGNLLVSSNAWLLMTNSNYTVILSSATIQAGGGIIADAFGYAAGQGPGQGQNYSGSPYTYPCGGAGHGGYGANSTGNYAAGGNTYDSITSPTSYGSGGGYYSPYSVGGAGGGAIWLNLKGTLQVAGVISANGGNGSGSGGGGGAGGSIWLAVGTLSGSGSITANGGSGADSIGGGGGGGRIYISCSNNSFTGNISAYGGGGANWGGAGTVLIQPATQNYQLVLDNGGHPGTSTPLQSVGSTDLILRNGAVGLLPSSLSFINLLVSSNAWLLMTNSNYTVTLSSATIQAGGGILADATGYAAGQGPGAGQYYYYNSIYPCSGAGHGGYGANSTGNYALGGSPYDSTTSPTSLGSGGGSYSPYSVGGAGGGAIRLNVSGILQVDGRISANGGNGSVSGGGGGSGGSIWLTVGTLSGAGSITANGGNGADAIGGGSGGGRISVGYTANSFGGLISAYGGSGANWGGAGTVYLKANSQSYGQLILDNGGNAGTNTTFSASSIDLLVAGSAIGQGPSGSWSVRNLQIRTNSVLTTVVSISSQTVNVTGNATIDVGGAISVDGTGSGASSGAGAGATASGSIKGGGGHGGFGAANPSGYGGAYGSIQSPVTAGSGGGNGSGSGTAPRGGAGGGALRLAVTGTLAVNGRVSANGKNGDVNSGGGSGGSLWITAGTLAGSGNISANGGAGNGLGGGGGGGRISLGYTTSVFSGPVSAGGGGGYAGGGAGTIYTKANSQSVGQLLVDNGGLAGTNTPLSAAYGTPASPFNLTVGDGAVVCPQSSFPVLSNLTITAGGLLTSLSGQSNLDLMVLQNVDIAAGGAIAVDAKGFAQASGPGAGQSVGGSGSGAGYGSLGGASATAPGGTNYGSAQQPVDRGSGGGFGSGPLYGGSEGGGAIRLNVGGVLTVDGQLSANGDWGLQDNSGGGSGGSIWVTAGTLVGNGQITADGGEGELYGGGGGAGGRIAIYSHANVFAGLASVFGGEGDFRGADGSIFYSANLPLQVLSHTPVGIVSNGVSSVDLVFNAAPDPASFSGTDVLLTTPNGPLAPGTLSVSMLSSSGYRVSFPLQTAVGNYSFTVGTNINDLYGQPMSQVYTGAFTISLPVIQGAVTGTNGQPVSGVLIQPDGGLSATTTGTNGSYALGILPGWSGTVVPSGGGFVFAPGSRVYTNVTTSISNQNYVAVITIAPVVSAGLQATNLMMNWLGISGVTYQLYSSTNLVDWLPYGDAFPGTNGPVELLVPTVGDPARFFRVQAGN
jgi:hypothetical protein